MSYAPHVSISSSNGFLKGENCIACAVTICSSRSPTASSNPEINEVGVFLN